MNIANLGINYPDNNKIQEAALSLKREIKRLKHNKFGYIKFPLVSFLCLINEIGMLEYVRANGITAKDITDPETLEKLKNYIVEAGIERSIANCNRFCRYVADALIYLNGQNIQNTAKATKASSDETMKKIEELKDCEKYYKDLKKYNELTNTLCKTEEDQGQLMKTISNGATREFFKCAMEMEKQIFDANPKLKTICKKSGLKLTGEILPNPKQEKPANVSTNENQFEEVKINIEFKEEPAEQGQQSAEQQQKDGQQ